MTAVHYMKNQGRTKLAPLALIVKLYPRYTSGARLTKIQITKPAFSDMSKEIASSGHVLEIATVIWSKVCPFKSELLT